MKEFWNHRGIEDATLGIFRNAGKRRKTGPRMTRIRANGLRRPSVFIHAYPRHPRSNSSFLHSCVFVPFVVFFRFHFQSRTTRIETNFDPGGVVAISRGLSEATPP